MMNQELVIKLPNDLGRIYLSSGEKNIDEGVSVENYLLKNILKNDNQYSPIEFDMNSSEFSKIRLLEETEYFIKFILDKKSNIEYDTFKSIKEHDSNDISFKSIENGGFLNFKSFAGKTFLDIYDGDKCIFKEPIEIRSKKINYDEQYKVMIEDLSSVYMELLFKINSPLYQNLKLKNFRKDENYYSNFIILTYLFKKENLPSIFEYLSRNLNSKLINNKEYISIAFASDIDGLELINAISNPENLAEVNECFSIFKIDNKNYAPLKINEINQIESIDTIENRFFKYFLLYISSIIGKLVGNINEGYVFDKLKEYESIINFYLSFNFFNDISNMNFVPLNSQVLQKKEGYKELLKFYLMLDFNFKLSWDDLIKTLESYQKQLYRLYEYWCFFQLINIFEELSNENVSFDDFINKNEWSFSLSEGKHVEFYYNDIRIKLIYNPTFNTRSNYYSYFAEVRPDYTIALYLKDEIKYIHFDAKYKVDLSNGQETYKSEDIIKMHAYRDAIVNTIGAYVLYPGSGDNEVKTIDEKMGYGVGAFSLNPGENNSEEIINLKNFIKKIINAELN